MDSLFQKSLNDVLKTLRLQATAGSHKGSSKAATDAYLSQVYADSLRECKSSDSHTKATALLKLLFLHMAQGVELQPAAFHCVEAMSSPRFWAKAVGYLVGSECLQEKPDMLLLATHLLRKDLGSPNQHEAGLALSCLSCVSSAELALDIGPDVLQLLQGSRAGVRRKATLALLRMAQRSPEVLRSAFRLLMARLEDSHSAVATAAVCVFCELALHDPPAFLPLAPNLVPLLVPTASPWVAIKLVKIVGALAAVEPRLVRKVQEPLTAIMNCTPSKSLLLECARTVISCMPQCTELRVLAVAKAAELLGTPDANLRYLGLQALISALPEYAPDVAAYKAAIIACFDHPDHSIQRLTLRLMAALVTEASLVPTVSVLCARLPSADSALAAEIASSVLGMCSVDSYSRVTDFNWYLDVLLDLCYLSTVRQGEEIGRQLADLALRVPGLQGSLVRAARRLVMDTPLLAQRPCAGHLLASAALLLGELGASVHFLPSSSASGAQVPSGTSELRELVEALLQPALQSLAPTLQGVYIQAAVKLLVKRVSRTAGPGQRVGPVLELLQVALQGLGPYAGSPHMEVQERACNAVATLKALREHVEGVPDLLPVGQEGAGGPVPRLFEISALSLPPAQPPKEALMVSGPDGKPWSCAQSRRVLPLLLSQVPLGREREHEDDAAFHLPTAEQLSWIGDRVSFSGEPWSRQSGGEPADKATVSGGMLPGAASSSSASASGSQGAGHSAKGAHADPRASPFYLPPSEKKRPSEGKDREGSANNGESASGPESIGPQQGQAGAPKGASLMGLLEETSSPVVRSHQVVSPTELNPRVNGTYG